MAVAFVSAAIGLYAWRRKDVPGARYLAVLLILVSPWQFGVAAGIAAADLATKGAWRVFEGVWPLFMATAGVCFVVEYVQPGRWLTRRSLIFLSIPPLLTAVLLLTPGWQHLIWRRLYWDGAVAPQYGSVGWVLLAYGIYLALVQIAALAWLFLRAPEMRGPVGLMLGSVIVTRILWYQGVLPPNTGAGPGSALTVSLVSVFAYAIALFGFRIFDPMPAARQMVIDQMLAGVLVFDARRRIVKLNPAAEKMLDMPGEGVVGKTWPQLASAHTELAAISEWSAAQSDVNQAPAEIAIERDGKLKQYVPTLSPLHDFRGLPVGHLLMLHDVTEQRKAQALIVEQQRSLATLREREQLARELHDSTGQVLAYAGYQVEAARRLIDDGHYAVAGGQLDRLAGVLRGAHADVRQQILDLRATPTAHQPFLAALQNYLGGFSSNYEIQTTLQLGAHVNDESLAPHVQAHLFRIIQEALSNARKHSGAHHIVVTIAKDCGSLRAVIEDDGCGMDEECTEARGGSHLGLQLMRERAAALAGRLRIESAPGAGTRIIVEIPEKAG